MLLRRIASYLSVLCLSVAPAGLTGFLGAGDFPPPVHPRPEQRWDPPHIGHEILVKLPNGDRRPLERAGLSVLRDIPALGLALVRLPAIISEPAAAADLERAGAVEWAEPNYTIHLDFIPNDPYYPGFQKYLANIDAAGAWDITLGRSEVVIAVIDTGVDMNHADLAGGIWSNPGEIPNNSIDDDANGFIDDAHGWDFSDDDNAPYDDHGHGTHVSGIAAARIGNGRGIAGLAGRATIMPLDVFSRGIGTYEDLIRAIVYAADNGAHVINMSLGASSYSRGEEMAVDYAFAHGVVMVAAAGNTSSEELRYPASHANVIAVASTGVDDSHSRFSTTGPWVDVAAPGAGIFSTCPFFVYLSDYCTMSGTSMAAPHVAGLAALILSRNGALTPAEVRAIIENTADDLGAPGRDNYFGEGRINAGRALASTPPDDQPPPPGPDPALDIDLPGCRELTVNGGFEDGLAAWQAEGAVGIDRTTFYADQASLHFTGGANLRGVVTQTLTIPASATAGVLKFAYRIDPKDAGRGTPLWPFDDWLTAEWRTQEGEVVTQLLRTGNTADTAADGLPWDSFLYRLEPLAFAGLKELGEVALVITAQGDADTLKTNFWLDSASFCVSGPGGSLRIFLPLAYVTG